MNTEWVNVVGKAIAQKSRVLDIENKIMQVEISSELKPIIEMSEDTIKKKLTQKFDFLENIEFVWY